MKFILILTLAVNIYSGRGGSGIGGLATAEFNDLAACESAAAQWKMQFNTLAPNSMEKNFALKSNSDTESRFITAMCVPQSKTEE